MKQKRMPELHRINKAVLIQYAILTVILFAAYMLEFVKGSRTLTYTLIFMFFDKSHKEFNDHNRYHKGNKYAGKKDSNFQSAHMNSRI